MRHSHTPSLVRSPSIDSFRTHSGLGTARERGDYKDHKNEDTAGQDTLNTSERSPRVNVNCPRPSYSVCDKRLVHTHQEGGCSLLSPASLTRSIPKPIALLLTNNRARAPAAT